MKIRKNGVFIKEAREIDIVSYLSELGHEATKVRAFDYWYFSLLRNEKTPQLKVI